MHFHNPSDRETKELAPGILARTFWGEKMLMAVVDLDPHTHLPNHSHPHEQVGIILSGKLEFTIAGQTRVLVPGDVYTIPGNVEHEAKTFEEPTKVMDVFSPVREEYQY
ncbi:MAG: cupin domain-containing protein [Chloroflexota bacterium]